MLLLREMGLWLQDQHAQGRLSDIRLQAMDRNLDELTAYHGGCERLSSTPIPHAYSVLLHRTVYIYCTLLPFSLLDSAGVLTPLISVFISYAFMALDAIASELEDPSAPSPTTWPSMRCASRSSAACSKWRMSNSCPSRTGPTRTMC